MKMKEEILVEGHKVILVYPQEVWPGGMDTIKALLTGQRDLTDRAAQICSEAKIMR